MILFGFSWVAYSIERGDLRCSRIKKLRLTSVSPDRPGIRTPIALVHGQISLNYFLSFLRSLLFHVEEQYTLAEARATLRAVEKRTRTLSDSRTRQMQRHVSDALLKGEETESWGLDRLLYSVLDNKAIQLFSSSVNTMSAIVRVSMRFIVMIWSLDSLTNDPVYHKCLTLAWQIDGVDIQIADNKDKIRF